MSNPLMCNECQQPIEGRYLVIADEQYCSDCYSEETTVSYFVGEEHIADDVDGAEVRHTLEN